MSNRIARFYPEEATVKSERVLARQLNDEYQYGYINGWQQAEDSRENRKNLLVSVAFTVGMIAGHFLTMFL